MHVEPAAYGENGELKASARSGEGLAGALRSVGRLSPPARFIISGGDHIMDGLERPVEDVERQWALYRETYARNCGLPCYALVGNHDILGWMNDSLDVETPGYGKGLACEMLGLESPYYSFEAEHEDGWGWHVVMLDNIQRAPGGYYSSYYGGVDPGQMHWLERDLAAVPEGRPILIVSHIPIVSVCAQHFFSPGQRTDFWRIYDVFVDRDSRELVELLARHNVKLCLSSHIHMLERIEFRGMTFICDGSISGNWWKGPFRGFPQGYGVVDLREDGTFEHRYVELQTA
jgi:3',5'-cyclic AMP phosphodiesterase CpdA